MNGKNTLSDAPQKKHRDSGRILYTGFLGSIMSYITPFFAGGQWTAP